VTGSVDESTESRALGARHDKLAVRFAATVKIAALDRMVAKIRTDVNSVDLGP
jgi:hypothetical protein